MTEERWGTRTLTRGEVDLAMHWAYREGWSPGHGDRNCYFNTDPSAFLAGTLDDDPVACIASLRFSQALGFIGFFFVRPRYRQQGLGRRLWERALEQQGERSIGVDVPLQLARFTEKWGFEKWSQILKFTGTGVRDEFPSGTEKLRGEPESELIELDGAYFGAKRPLFLKSWINQPGALALGVRGSDGKLNSYGMIRPTGQGWRVGPLFLNDPEAASKLLKALRCFAGAGNKIHIDLPSSNVDALNLIQKSGFAKTGATSRLFRGEPPLISKSCIYGFTTTELG